MVVSLVDDLVSSLVHTQARAPSYLYGSLFVRVAIDGANRVAHTLG